MKELKIETSSQKLYWDSENEIVWGALFANQVTEELAKENVAMHRKGFAISWVRRKSACWWT